ncbi:2-epi-5-epi-valiolone synthase [Astyanax mexicanus]|uniref:2-epi-5-epi-valiolone synthase n=1 Tax=Astyanax mexicanus TaxID=7994 RepID=UPI0020CB1347|nr:2-epi-5-epi-valiolone synthase [Astyanax mexicanus]
MSLTGTGPGTEFSLIRTNGTWSRRAGPGTNKPVTSGPGTSPPGTSGPSTSPPGTTGGPAGEHLSQAKLYQCSNGYGVTWTVESPVVFSYRVVECEKLLDMSNDTLLFGHVGDAEELRVLKESSKPLRRFVIIDETVNEIYGAQVEAYLKSWQVIYKLLPLPTTEQNKSLELVSRILKELQRFGIDRRLEPIVAIGGGVCLDVAGLAASLYRRRTPYVRVPTTLLSYIDASVGAKNGVNFCGCKNRLGSYTPPVAALLDRGFIKSLPRRHIANGLAEMLKMALMKHKGLFELLEKEGRGLLDSAFQSSDTISGCGCTDPASLATRVAIVTMLEELAPNLWEDDLDRLVDFGHVISPELEMVALPELLHGEAVCVDMALMVFVSRERGFLSGDELRRIISCMKSLELPVWDSQCSEDLLHSALSARLTHCGGALRLPLPTGLGTAGIFSDLDPPTLSRAYQNWCSELGSGRSGLSESEISN